MSWAPRRSTPQPGPSGWKASHCPRRYASGPRTGVHAEALTAEALRTSDARRAVVPVASDCRSSVVPFERCHREA